MNSKEEILKSKIDELSMDNGNYPTYNHWEKVVKDYILEAMEEYASQFREKPKKTIEERHSDFFWNVKNLFDKHRNEIDGVDVVDFVNYWTEISPNAKKMRFEKEKVFDIKKRLERWKRNQKTFNNGNQQQSTSEALSKFITE